MQSAFQKVEELVEQGDQLENHKDLAEQACREGVEWAIICALNFEAEGRSSAQARPWPVVASQGQQVALQTIREAAAYYSRDPLQELSKTDWTKLVHIKGLSYNGQEVERGGPLVLGELMPGLPKAGLAGSVKAMDIAAPHVQKWLEDPTLLLKPRAEWPETVPRAAVQVKSDEEWFAICAHLVTTGIFAVVEEDEIFCVNGEQVLAGAFAVGKSGEPTPPFSRVTRLIINMVPQNAYQRIAETDLTTLTPSSSWTGIVIEDGQVLLWSSDDQTGAFHLYALPAALRGYMAIRKAVPGARVGRPDRAWVKMCVCVIPMGWLSAVSLFQHLHRRLGVGPEGLSAGFEKEAEWRRDRPLPLFPRAPSQAWVQYYLDDFDTPEIVPESVASMIEGTVGDYQRRQREAYKAAGVPWSEKKAACRQARLVRMGALVDGIVGRVSVSVENQINVGRLILWLLGEKDTTAKATLMGLGRLARAFEFRRPLFATLNEVWHIPALRRATELGGRALMSPVRLAGDARAELLSAVCLLPMAYTDLRASLDPMVLATDASEEGGGMCYTTGLTKYGAEVAGRPCGEEGTAFLPRGAMIAKIPPEMLSFGEELPTVALFDLFGGVGAAMVALSRCPCRVVLYVSCETDKLAKRCVRQRWPGVIELGDITKVSSSDMEKLAQSALEVAQCAIIGGGSPCVDLSGLNVAGKGLEGDRSGLFFQMPRLFKAVQKVFGKTRCSWFVENVASMKQEEIVKFTKELGTKPYRMEAMQLGAVRRPRLYWLSWPVRELKGVVQVVECEFYFKVTFTIDRANFPVWADEGWGLLDPAQTLPTFARLIVRKQPPAPATGLDRASPEAIGRWTDAGYITQVYNFEDKHLLWNTARTEWRIPSADERETLMGFDRGYTQAAVKESVDAREREVVRCALIGNSFSVQCVSYLFAQLLAHAGGKPAPQVVPLLRTGVAPASWAVNPCFAEPEVADPELEQVLVYKYLRIASRGGADVRLDLQAPFRAKAWPRSGLQATLWSWSIGHGFPWRETAHINELEIGAAVNAVKWRARACARFNSRYLHLLDSQVAASVLAKGRSSARRLWGWMRGHAAYLIASGCYPIYGYVDTDDNPADVPSRWFDGCRRGRKR